MKKRVAFILVFALLLSAVAFAAGSITKNGVIYSEDGKTVLGVEKGKTGDIVIENGVTKIDESAFAGSQITSVTLPETVTDIEYGSFSGCRKLTKLDMPSSVKSIKNGAFAGDTSLAYVSVPKDISFISPTAFDGCNALNHVFFKGSEQQWSALSVLSDKTVHYGVGLEKVKIEKVPALDCTEDSDIKHTCTVCNKVILIQKEKALHSEHSFGFYALKDGYMTATCKNAGCTVTDSYKYFTDVPKNAWYKPYVDYAVNKGIFSGTSENTFSPNADMTRAQFVRVLANLTGAKLNDNVQTGFSDTPSGKWFTGAVKWAVDNGVAKGTGNGTFNPTGKIDRQQMCVMLVNYVENFKKSTLKKETTAKTFADDKTIAGWAKTAVYKCANAKLVNGVGDNKFAPTVVANRATGATIFTNFHKQYMK